MKTTFALVAAALMVAPLPALAQGECVTSTLSVFYCYEDSTESAAAMTININPAPPPPPKRAEDDMFGGVPEEPMTEGGAPVECPTLNLPAADPRAQTVCEMADTLAGARCIRQWSGRTLRIEPFD